MIVLWLTAHVCLISFKRYGEKKQTILQYNLYSCKIEIIALNWCDYNILKGNIVMRLRSLVVTWACLKGLFK